MNYRRIIICLDVKDGRLVKGTKFVDLKDVGEPSENAAAYSAAGADEVVFLDITATLENRKTLIEAVKRTARRITVPLTVGGGVSTIADIKRLLEAGASRVSINTAAFKNPALVEEAAGVFGADRLVVAIDTRQNPALGSGFEVMIKGGKEATGKDAVQWAREAQARGAGSILATSMDADGTREGYDIPMTRALADVVTVPVIASGGAGKLEHLYQGVVEGHADALLVASLAHFGIHSIREMKEYLAERGVPVRL